jgi:predicted O-linked N-acetylglucosamine transferase (SPINDLY family)
MGNALREQGKLEEAIEAYNKALAIKPDYADAYINMGNALQDQGKLEEAIAAFNKALAIQPDYEAARGQKLHQLAHICDWDAIGKDSTLIPSLGTSEKFVPPFVMLSLEDAPDSHRIRSEVYAKAMYPQRPLPLPALPSKKPKRIRIGYFSADFHNHATMYLMAKVFAAHDRQKFEVYAYSYGPDANDQMRQVLIKSVDVFEDVREMGFKDTALRSRQDKIDIAVDLKGHTQDQRLGIFAYRPAPTQISYLGYPGTIGAEFIDYIVADPVVVPSNRRSAYSEEIIYLPHTYQPNDDKRVISQKVTTKADMGLPEDGFVFCCFNSNYKISPAEFDIWMRLLGKVNGSVLWLLKSNRWAEQNLQREAEKRGIQANRLVFAEKLPHDQHLGRQKHADLFIDTFNVNAHTTASDALWAGLPIVTKLGQGFAARVAGSLLTAVGLTELITENEQDYEALILELATNPVKLANVREKLAVNRLSQPLFDTQQYTKHLEDAYQQAYQNYFEGKSPQTIVVPS